MIEKFPWFYASQPINKRELPTDTCNQQICPRINSFDHTYCDRVESLDSSNNNQIDPAIPFITYSQDGTFRAVDKRKCTLCSILGDRPDRVNNVIHYHL